MARIRNPENGSHQSMHQGIFISSEHVSGEYVLMTFNLEIRKKMVHMNREQVLLNLSRYLAEENLISREEQLLMMKRIKEGRGGSDYVRE